MRSVTVIILLAAIAHTHAKDSMDKLVDTFFDKMVNHLLNRGVQRLRFHHADVDKTALGKPGQDASPPSSACCAARWQGHSEGAAMAVLSHHTDHLPVTRPRRLMEEGEKVERTYVMLKPDGVQRGLVGEVISRFERKGFYLKGLKMIQCAEDLAKEHYADLKEKPFYDNLVQYICSGPVVCMVWEGKGVVKSARTLIGATNPLESAPGTIRGDFAVEVGRNVIHGSDSIENGEKEIGLWFGDGKGMADWKPAMEPWLRESGR